MERLGLEQARSAQPAGAGISPTPNNWVNRKFRLTRSTDYQRVRQFGKSYAHPLLVLVALVNETNQTQCAISAGRGVGGAVERNRAKRLIREALRPWMKDLLPGWDIVLIARRPMSETTLQETQAVLHLLLKRARLLKAAPVIATK